MNQPRGYISKITGGGMALVLLIGLTACGGPPKWVKQGSGAFNDKDSKAFYGVGSVTGVRSPGIRRKIVLGQKSPRPLKRILATS